MPCGPTAGSSRRVWKPAGGSLPPNPADLVSKVGIEVQKIDTSKSVPFTKAGVAGRLRIDDELPPPCPYVPKTGMKVGSVTKTFAEVSWHVCFRDMGLKGLWVGPVQMKLTPNSSWTEVIYQAGLAEIFVPYHDTNFRPYDMQFCPTGGCRLDTLTAQDKGPTGNLVTLTEETLPTVVTEIRDRGVAWMCKQVTATTRRGEELLVWGVTDGGNYDNIVQYGFRDDGTMTFRMGNTGFTPVQDGLNREAHTHNGLWRVDMDLNGFAQDSALLWEHREPKQGSLPLLAKDLHPAFDGNTEGGAVSSSPRVTSVLIEDNAVNKFGDKLGYDFHLAQAQTSRHFGPLDDWTKRDFWVTRYQNNGQTWVNNFMPPDDYLLSQAGDNQDVSETDAVVWVKSSAHHEPKGEDRAANDTDPSTISGVTNAHWSGFDVEPRNLFDANPMGGPSRCWP